MPNITSSRHRFQDTFGNIPYIRIHDYVLRESDIVEFWLMTNEFLPTIYLHVQMATNTLGNTNKLDDGDLIHIGIRSDLKVFRPLTADYIVTRVDGWNVIRDGVESGEYEYEIWGQLNIPLLESEKIRFSYMGYAEDALREIAKRIGLGFVINSSPSSNKGKNGRTNTDHEEVWECFQTPKQFIDNVTKHMWAGVDSFFDTWIDPYSNLVNINVGDMLGRHIEDDGVLDITKYRSVVQTQAADGLWAHNDLTPLEHAPDNKLLTNYLGNQTSVWNVQTYKLMNRSTEITRKYGITKKYSVYIQNNGLGQSLNDSERSVDIGVWYNPDKIQLGYVTLNGPTTQDKRYEKVDNGSYIDQNYQRTPPQIFPIESDNDAEDRSQSKNNLKASGNFSKKYFLAPEHNLLNLVELEKQHLIVTVNGFNNGLIRGEKVPCMIFRNSNEKYVSDTRSTPDDSYRMDSVCSGWFYVRGIKYCFKPNPDPNNVATDWTTEITLTRREWFPPESTATAMMAGDTTNIPTNDSSTAIGVMTGNVKLNNILDNVVDADDNIFESVRDYPPDPDNEYASVMEAEVNGNLEGLENASDAIDAIDSIEKVEEVVDETMTQIEPEDAGEYATLTEIFDYNSYVLDMVDYGNSIFLYPLRAYFNDSKERYGFKEWTSDQLRIHEDKIKFYMNALNIDFAEFSKFRTIGYINNFFFDEESGILYFCDANTPVPDSLSKFYEMYNSRQSGSKYSYTTRLSNGEKVFKIISGNLK